MLKRAVASVRAAFPEAQHTIYNKETLRQFMVENFDAEVVWAYDKIIPYTYKTDLARYCLLYRLGGWYFDISIRMHTKITPRDTVEFLAFRDVQRHALNCWACSTSVLYAKPQNPVFDIAIKMIIENCRQEYYGITPLCPTGPSLLGKALAAHGSQRNFMYGDRLELTPLHQVKNPAYIMPDGTIAAWGKNAGGGDLAALGAKGVQNYNEFWHARNVYAKN